MTSRGCPYPCTFCSVAPVWNLESYSRSPKNIVDEMEFLHRQAGVQLFLFQDEFFVSGKSQVVEFCRELASRRLNVEWKAFGRVNLVDPEMMAPWPTPAVSSCVSASNRARTASCSGSQGLYAAQTLEVVPRAIEFFPARGRLLRLGFPFRDDGGFPTNALPNGLIPYAGCAHPAQSALALAADGDLSRICGAGRQLEFCPYLFPEFVFTGHEVCHGGRIELPERYREYFDLILHNPDIFPGFFHIDLAGNVLPKLAQLRQFGFYPEAEAEPSQCRELWSPFTGAVGGGPGTGLGHAFRAAPQLSLKKSGRPGRHQLTGKTVIRFFLAWRKGHLFVGRQNGLRLDDMPLAIQAKQKFIFPPQPRGRTNSRSKASHPNVRQTGSCRRTVLRRSNGPDHAVGHVSR